jgi:hypothetical protein
MRMYLLCEVPRFDVAEELLGSRGEVEGELEAEDRVDAVEKVKRARHLLLDLEVKKKKQEMSHKYKRMTTRREKEKGKRPIEVQGPHGLFDNVVLP